MQSDPPPDIRRRLPLWVGVALCLGALGAGAVVLPMLRLDPVARVQQAPDLSAPSPETATPAATPAPEPDPRAPRFDLVRNDADGRVIVAGRAFPGALVGLVVDGVTVAETTSDGSGQFVAFLTLDASAEPRVLWLVTQNAAGGIVNSADTVILAPDAPTGPAPAGNGRTAVAASMSRPEAAAPAPGGGADTFGRGPTDVGAAPVQEPRGPDPAQGRAAQHRGSAPAPMTDPQAAATAGPAALARTVPLVSGADGVRVMASAPLAGEAVRLDSVDYAAEGAVVLRGRARPGGIVRAALSGLPPVETAPDADGTWTLRLHGVAPGDYQLDIARAAAPGAAATDSMTIPFRRATPADVAAALSGEAARIVTVQPGATLWAIARDRYGDGGRYVQVYDANRDAIGDPDLIYPGQVFRLPDTSGNGAVARPIAAPR